METTALREAYRDLVTAASIVAGSDEDPTPPPGEWNADQILGHVALVTATTISAACAVVSGAITTYDNRLALDTWTIDRVSALAGGNEGLRERIQLHADALCALVSGLSETELDSLIPTLLLSNDALLVQDQLPLRDLLDGLATNELPGHADQLRRLVSGQANGHERQEQPA